jgi:cytidylate kinase
MPCGSSAPAHCRSAPAASCSANLYPEAVLRVAERDAADTAKLLRLYGVDYHDPTYYHLTVNTEELGPEEVAERILAAARA